MSCFFRIFQLRSYIAFIVFIVFILYWVSTGLPQIRFHCILSALVLLCFTTLVLLCFTCTSLWTKAFCHMNTCVMLYCAASLNHLVLIITLAFLARHHFSVSRCVTQKINGRCILTSKLWIFLSWSWKQQSRRADVKRSLIKRAVCSQGSWVGGGGQGRWLSPPAATRLSAPSARLPGPTSEGPINAGFCTEVVGKSPSFHPSRRLQRLNISVPFSVR